MRPEREVESSDAALFSCERITILAAPPCAGKSFLLDRIDRHGGPEVRSLLGIRADEGFLVVEASRLEELRGGHFAHVLVHFDLLRQRRQDGGFRYVRSLVAGAKEAQVVTLWPARTVLQSRVRQRLLEGLGRILRREEGLRSLGFRLRKAYRLASFYDDAGKVRRLCGDWLSFCSTLDPTTSVWVSVTPPAREPFDRRNDAQALADRLAGRIP